MGFPLFYPTFSAQFWDYLQSLGLIQTHSSWLVYFKWISTCGIHCLVVKGEFTFWWNARKQGPEDCMQAHLLPFVGSVRESSKKCNLRSFRLPVSIALTHFPLQTLHIPIMQIACVLILPWMQTCRPVLSILWMELTWCWTGYIFIGSEAGSGPKNRYLCLIAL